MDEKSKGKKVFVGLSGGVDSAVSAALLQKEGYDVTGVFIKVWQPDWIECSWKEDRRDAMRVAAHLNIPFFTLDLEKEYKEGVIDYMIAEYKAGRTPNPDVMCNREVKFGAFWRWARLQGADFIATGHYARSGDVSRRSGDIHFSGSGKGSAELFPNHQRDPDFRRDDTRHRFFPRNRLRTSLETNIPGASGKSMFAGIDSNKDQSYFLWTLKQEDLRHVIFPIGELTKPEVRKLAEKFGLPNAAKKDSQGLCFIGKIDVKDFLKHYIHTEQGDVLDSQGKIIGQHPGALLFTIGERHGFVVTEKTKNNMPYYVVAKNVENNTITVSNKGPSGFLAGVNKKVILEKVNWISGLPPQIKISGEKIFNLQARARYRQALQNIRIVSVNDANTVVEFEKAEDAITPGQSLVIYDGEVCLGGGIILAK